MWKAFSKMSANNKMIVGGALLVLLICIFWPRPSGFSMGVSAHLGNLRGTVELEAFDVSSKKKTLALYYAPWCGYCKRFMPTWDQFERENSGRTDVDIVKINADEDKELAKKAGISGFPTIKYYPEGMSNLDNAQVLKRAGDNGTEDMRTLTDFLGSVGSSK